MKFTLVILALIVFSNTHAHNFNNEWRDIKRQAQNVWDEDDLQNAQNDASSLADDIEDYLDEDTDIEVGEKQNLNRLIVKVEAVEDFIRIVLRGYSGYISNSTFTVAASELGVSYSTINDSKQVNLVQVEIDGFVSLMAWNTDATSGYEMVINYKDVGGSSTHNYKATIAKSSSRHMGDNRDDKNVKSWKLVSMKLTVMVSKY